MDSETSVTRFKSTLRIVEENDLGFTRVDDEAILIEDLDRSFDIAFDGSGFRRLRRTRNLE